MLRVFAGTQVNSLSLVFQISTASRESIQPLSSICSGSEPFIPVEHLAVRRRWNIPANKFGNSAGELVYQLFWSSSVCNSCPNPSSIFFNSLQLDLLFDLHYLGLKFPDLFRSESFRSFMLCFHTQFNSIFLDIVFSDLIHRSFFFSHLQGTAPMLCTRSVAIA